MSFIDSYVYFTFALRVHLFIYTRQLFCGPRRYESQTCDVSQ